MGCIAPPWELPPLARPNRSLSLQLPTARCATVTAYFFHPASRSPYPHGTVRRRCVLKGGAVVVTVPRPSFALFGRDPSVVLETLKRGDLDVGGKDVLCYDFTRPLEATLLSACRLGSTWVGSSLRTRRICLWMIGLRRRSHGSRRPAKRVGMNSLGRRCRTGLRSAGLKSNRLL